MPDSSEHTKDTRFAVTNYDSYVSIALASRIDWDVFGQLGIHYQAEAARLDEVARTGKNPSAMFRNEIHAFVNTIVYCCFAVESYANVIADYVCEPSKLQGFVRKESTKNKLPLLIKKVSNIDEDCGKEPHQSLNRLIMLRDQLVHDKGAFPQSPEHLEQLPNRRKPELTPHEAIQVIVRLSEYINSGPLSVVNCSLMSPVHLHSATDWNESSRLRITGNLPFEHASFPSIHRYLEFVRRHVGQYPRQVFASEDGSKIMASKWTNSA